jgi:hypothetical protein
MAIQSTAKILASIVGKSQTQSPETNIQEPRELFSIPQLTPSPDMEHVLSNILGHSASKKYSPMD